MIDHALSKKKYQDDFMPQVYEWVIKSSRPDSEDDRELLNV